MLDRWRQDHTQSVDRLTRPLVNVLEEAVIAEAQRQIDELDSQVRLKVDLTDVAAYALNRMQPLYATNWNGWTQQREKAIHRCSGEIRDLIRKGIRVVLRTPARNSQPLPQTQRYQAILKGIREILGDPELEWDGVLDALQQWKMANDANLILEDLRILVRDPDLTWDQVIPALLKWKRG